MRVSGPALDRKRPPWPCSSSSLGARLRHRPFTRMIDVDEARARILAAFAPLPMVRVPLAEALGSVLAVDVIAGSSVPAFPNAAMDGFAVRAAETCGASAEQPARLRVIAEAAAGYESASVVTPGTAVRIMTGAPVPAGADAVVRFEETDEGTGAVRHGPGDTVAIMTSVRPGENVRPDRRGRCTPARRSLRPERGCVPRKSASWPRSIARRPPSTAGRGSGSWRPAMRSSMPASHWGQDRSATATRRCLPPW